MFTNRSQLNTTQINSFPYAIVNMSNTMSSQFNSMATITLELYPSISYSSQSNFYSNFINEVISSSSFSSIFSSTSTFTTFISIGTSMSSQFTISSKLENIVLLQTKVQSQSNFNSNISITILPSSQMSSQSNMSTKYQVFLPLGSVSMSSGFNFDVDIENIVESRANFSSIFTKQSHFVIPGRLLFRGKQMSR